MKRTLHITNGDSAANIIKTFSQADDVLPWRDPMHHGPFPLTSTLDDISRVRIEYLSGKNNALTPQAIEPLLSLDSSHDFTERDALLARSNDYDEVVLWFEHDLLDQLQLLQLLSWYCANPIENTTLSLICIDHFEGIDLFRGIGQLSSEQMESLLPTREVVAPDTLKLAELCWQLFRQPDPTPLQAQCETIEFSTTQLPFLGKALHRYFEEFPWVSDGLSRTERQLLTLVHQGVTQPHTLFVENMNLESCLYAGDWRTYSHIAQLCEAVQPLLACNAEQGFRHPASSALPVNEFQAQTLRLTELGLQALKGEKSAFNAIARNEWLGGVYLDSTKPLWCWDSRAGQLYQSV